MISKRLPKDIYNRCITFVYGSPAEFHRFMRRRYDNEIAVDPSRISKRGYAQDYIFLRRIGRRDDQLVFLAHETLHVVHNALRVAGLPLTDDTIEAYTYYQGWLMAECIKAMR